MNVLIITPDAVGSTLLQRLITIYMQFHDYDRPVINLHELTNGLVRYHNPVLNQHVLGKEDQAWGYHQSLEQVVQLLSSVDHYKTSRLAHYHIQNRRDSMADQVPFYQYLNDNFYIISCRRHNLFEHALSWSLSKITKKLNVYTDTEKIDSFFEYYKNGIDLDPNSLIQTLKAYKDYTDWCNNHFNVASYFYYEEHVPCIEQYILNLPIFAQQTKKLTWQDNFDIGFDQWNMYRYLGSDLGTLALDQPEKFAQLTNSASMTKIDVNLESFLHRYQQVADPDWPAICSLQDYHDLPEHIRREVEQERKVQVPLGSQPSYRIQLAQPLIQLLPEKYQEFLKQNKPAVDHSLEQIQAMVKTRVLVSAPPIKKQILAEKKYMVKNYQHLLEVYNKWIQQHPDLGKPLENATLDQFAELEKIRWQPASSALAVSAEQKTH